VRQLSHNELAVRRLAEIIAPRRRHLQQLPHAREFPRQVRDEGLERLLAFVLFRAITPIGGAQMLVRSRWGDFRRPCGSRAHFLRFIARFLFTSPAASAVTSQKNTDRRAQAHPDSETDAERA
jgi:hypothetical protein